MDLLNNIDKANKICLQKLNNLFNYTNQTIFPEIHNTLKNVICEYMKFEKVSLSMSLVMKSIISNSNWNASYVQICDDYIVTLNHYKNSVIYNIKQLSYNFDILSLPEHYNIIKDDGTEFSADCLSVYCKQKNISINDDEDLLSKSISVIKYMEYVINKFNTIIDDNYTCD